MTTKKSITQSTKQQSKQHNRGGNTRNKWKEFRRPFMIGLFFLFTLSFSTIMLTHLDSNVSVVKADQQLGDIQYKIIEIQSGDSLWSIAKANMSPGFSDIYAYIDEIKRCNQLESDLITAGHYLLIPYYDAI